MKQQAGEYGIAFLLGFFLYAMLEIAGRGYTHWTMGLAGGIAMTVLYSMEQKLSCSRLTCALLGAVFVTSLEFTVGVFDNIIMQWAVWDYHDRPFNLLGQICPSFSAIWFLLCLFASGLCSLLHSRLHASNVRMYSVSSQAISHCSGMRG